MAGTVAQITIEGTGGNGEVLLAIATAVAANIVALVTVGLQIRSSFRLLRAERQIDAHGGRLTEFYGPLLSLLNANGDIFRRAGPPAFPGQEGARRRAAAASWKLAKQKMLSNNAAMESLILSKAHHLAPGDEMNAYMELLVHLQMYQVFQEKETDWYLENFRFPAGIVDHVTRWHAAEKAAYEEALGGARKVLRK